MEAASPRRAAFRLAAALAGSVLAVGMTAAALWIGVSAPAPRDVAPDDTPRFAPSAAYQLPVTPLPIAEPARLPFQMAPAAAVLASRTPDPYSPPLAPPEAIAEEAAPGVPMTIHNPAAMGPPEDDEAPRFTVPGRGGPRVATPTPSKVLDEVDDYATEAWDFDGAGDDNDPLATPEGVAETSAERPSARLAMLKRAHDEPSEPLRRLADPDRQSLLTYTASTNQLSQRLAGEVQAGFQLGKAGAVYAAREKFVSVLRRIALAKDAEEGSTRHATALAEGLRTLDDADDFVPRGDALEAELDVAAIARSHGVGIVSDSGRVVAPHEAVARYAQHAARRLAEAAAEEPAGSMALYGLGKTYARLEAQGGDPSAGRKSMVMYRAAIDAHGQNFLAANELGVTLARVGRYEQASQVLRRAASQPAAIATVHENLAAVERRLGHDRTAVAAQQTSQRLAMQEREAGEVSRRHGVEWVKPEAFQRVGGPQAQPAPAPAVPGPGPVASAPAPAPASEGGWSRVVRAAKRATGWSTTTPTVAPPTPSAPPVAQPPVYR